MADNTGLQFTVKVGALADSTFAVASFKLDEGLNSVTLAPDCAERVVHLTAKDEWRYFFALTRITDDVAGKQIAPNFTELALPGYGYHLHSHP